MHCDYYDAGLCRSCTRMNEPYPAQLADKQERLRQLLAPHRPEAWLEPVPSPESGFRNKAKMVVSGTVERPLLGILDRDGHGIDLTGCGLYPPQLLAAMPALRRIIGEFGLTPYDVPARRGELKHLLLTISPDGELLLRFVLRSKKHLVPLKRGLPRILELLPAARVVSVNIQREHQAILEGPEEITLTEQATLPMRLNGIPLALRPQGFFQTNSHIAAALYRQGAEWFADSGAGSLWDLYCGVGGFALHAARRVPGARVLGLEISEQAVAAARITAADLGLERVRFTAGDATGIATGIAAGAGRRAPEALVVNPPRRGLGPELAAWIEESGIPTVIYSSCHAPSLVRDLSAMPSLSVRRARLFDMFPQTDHAETMVLLSRR